MIHTLLFCLFLATTASIHGMHLTTIVSSPDLFTHISPLLERSRDSLKCTSKLCHTLVTSQDKLNKNYISAHTNKNTAGIKLWGLRGGMLPYTELAHAINNKKINLAQWLIKHTKITSDDALSMSTKDNNTTLIQWLLNNYKPSLYLTKNCLTEARNLKLVEIIELLENYNKKYYYLCHNLYPEFPSSNKIHKPSTYDHKCNNRMYDAYYP